MALDYELPVWPFMPNWREGVLERLSWGTVVMSSETGAEQRYRVRLSPRREFEATFNPIGNARTFFDLFVSTLGGQEMMIPLWHDRHKLTDAATNTLRIDCHTEHGEFVAGGMALLVGPDPWSHEAVRVEAVDSTGLDLVAVTSGVAYPAGTLILPLRRSRIDQPTLRAITSAVGEVQMRFMLNQANALADEGAWSGFEFSGYPVVTSIANWVDGIDIGLTRILETEDNGTGIPFLRDIAERAFHTKKHNWQVRGRQANYEFRQFLYRMGGRSTPVWMPTGNRDFIVSTDAAIGAPGVNVQKVGLTYVGGPQPGRERVLARTAAGYQVRTVTAMGVPPDADSERLTLNTPLAYAVPAGSVLEFIELMRAEGDDIELMHHTDVEGMTECSINFRAFSDTRVAATPYVVDYPTAIPSGISCGVSDDPSSPCIPEYNPWSLRIEMTFLLNDNHGPTYFPNVYYPAPLPQAVTAGMMPNGRTFAKGSDISLTGSGWDSAVYPTPLGVGGEPTMWVKLDNDNPDGSPGGPVIAFHSKGASGIIGLDGRPLLLGYEWFFFFPISGDPDDRHMAWNHQFGFIECCNGTPFGDARITVSGDASATQDTFIERLWPTGYGIDY